MLQKEFLSQFNYFYIESHNIDIPKLISAVLEKDGLLSLDTKRAKQSKSLDALKEFIRLSSEAISDIEKNINVVFKKFTDFDGILKGKSVRINFAEFDKLRDAIKNMTSITLNDGNSHGMASKGSGAQRAVFISLMQFISQNTKRKVIWGIDEPEAFLQPKLQKRVFEVFQEIVTSKKQPVIITTHSQHFIKLNKLTTTHIFKGVVEKRIYQRRPSEVFYEIDTRPIECASDSEKANHIKEHLGISNNDGWELLPFNLLVEGFTDKKYFELFFKNLGQTQPNIINSGSATKIAGFLQFYENFAKDLPYKPKIVCIFDNDTEGREQFNRIKPQSYKYLTVKVVSIKRFDGKINTSKSTDENWEMEDLLPPHLILATINILLKQEKYKKISDAQFADRVKAAHHGKQILNYVQECITQNNPNLQPINLQNDGRKLQICELFCRQIEANNLQLNLTAKYKEFLKDLLN